MLKTATFFTNKDLTPVTEELLISTYFPRFLKEFFEKNSFTRAFSSDEYLICPKYKEGDVQIGGTGTIHQKETHLEGLVRESLEEFLISPCDYDQIEGEKRNFIFTNNFSVEDPEHFPLFAKGRSSREKCGFFYFQTHDFWAERMDNYNHPVTKRIQMSDNIVENVFIRMDSVRDIIVSLF